MKPEGTVYLVLLLSSSDFSHVRNNYMLTNKKVCVLLVQQNNSLCMTPFGELFRYVKKLIQKSPCFPTLGKYNRSEC